MSYFVYIATNKTNRVLYTGVTNNIVRRMSEHKEGFIEGFTKKYRVKKLVFVQEFKSIQDAIVSEKKIKGWLRKKKIELIKGLNPTFEDLLF